MSRHFDETIIDAAPAAGDEMKPSDEIDGYWPKDDIRRAFVAGAKWWEWHKEGATMWQSDTREAEDEAEKRYPGGKLPGMGGAK